MVMTHGSTRRGTPSSLLFWFGLQASLSDDHTGKCFILLSFHSYLSILGKET